jgi:hypothetical protein
MIVSRPEKTFEPLPVGLEPAICINYFDLGLQRGFRGKTQHKVVLLFELETRKKDGSPFLASKKYTASLDEKANLLKDLQSWRGVAFTDQELKGFNLDSIKGKGCQLNLVPIRKADGDPSVVVDAIMRPRRDWKQFQVQTAPDYIPEWVLEAIDAQIGSGQGHSVPDIDDDVTFDNQPELEPTF